MSLIITESVQYVETHNNLEDLKKEYEEKKKNASFYYREKPPTKATVKHFEIHEKETGMPIAKGKLTSHGYKSVYIDWHPEFLKIHPMVHDNPWMNMKSIGYKETSKADIERHVFETLNAAHQYQYRKPFDINVEEKSDENGIEFNYTIYKGPEKVITHNVKKDQTGTTHNVQFHGSYDQNLDTMQKDAASKLLKGGIGHYPGPQSYHEDEARKALLNVHAETKKSKPFAVIHARDNNHTVYKTHLSDEDASKEHETYLKKQGHNIERLTPTFFEASKDGTHTYSKSKDGHIHVTNHRSLNQMNHYYTVSSTTALRNE